jgi:hypothetical protein
MAHWTNTETKHVDRLGFCKLGLRSAAVGLRLYSGAHRQFHDASVPVGWRNSDRLAVRCGLCVRNVLSSRHRSADIEVGWGPRSGTLSARIMPQPWGDRKRPSAAFGGADRQAN